MGQTEGKIFLADQRLEEKSSTYRSLCSNMRGLRSDIQICEFVLAAEGFLKNRLSTCDSKILIPLSGNLKVTIKRETFLLKALTAAVMTEGFLVRNSYSENPIHWLEISWVGNAFTKAINMSFLSQQNQLHLLLNGHGGKVWLGKYKGRAGGFLNVSPDSDIFVFVLGGIFEVQNRLLTGRDGLWIAGLNRLEFEELTTDGIIFVFVR